METLDYCVYSKKGVIALDNQRGIVKSCAISNLQNKILFHRITSVTESKLLGLQSGFRSGRSTTEQIITLRFLLDAARTQKRSLTVVFVDCGNAFISVDRRAFPIVLRYYGVPGPTGLHLDSFRICRRCCHYQRLRQRCLKCLTPAPVSFRGDRSEIEFGKNKSSSCRI